MATAIFAFFAGIGVGVGSLLVLVWREAVKVYEATE